MPRSVAEEKARGRDAVGPRQIPARGWKDILWRLWAEYGEDRLALIAAGATFYLLLALFPALAAFVSMYGFVADPVTIADHIAFLGGVLPAGGIELISTQLRALASQDEAALSFAFIFGLLFALWSANNGIKTLFEALNVAYEETEKRGFFKLNLISLVFTMGAIVIAILFIVSVGIVPAVLALVGLGPIAETLISLARWPVLFLAAAAGISILYRYGPSRERAKWRWVNWGAMLATLVWLLSSVLFSWYLTNFADYNATYGSLGAVIGFMMWTWISVVILLLGAELNAELEHQTTRDSTTGPEQPMGSRGATMADTLGEASDSGRDPENRGGETAGLPRREPKRAAFSSHAQAELTSAEEKPGLLRSLGLSLVALGAGPVLEKLRKRNGSQSQPTI
jgi:membrane protein